MKKVYTLFLSMAVAGFSFGQKSFTVEKTFDKAPNSVVKSSVPTDTIPPGQFESGSPTLYSAQSGYVVGNNQYGDLEKSQQFILLDPTIVEEALLWFGAKIEGSGDPNSKVTVNLRAMDGTGTLDDGSGNAVSGPVPGTVLASADVLLSDIDTAGNYTVAQFSTPTYVNADYALGFNVSGLAALDTVGLVTSADGDGGQAQLTFEQWSDGSWYSMLYAWPLDFDLGIWAVIDNSSASIDGDTYFQGMKMSQNMPNPANGVTTIEYELERYNESVELEVIDVTGKRVLSIKEGEKVAGQHKIEIDANLLASGTYYYSLKTDNGRLTKKMVITK